MEYKIIVKDGYNAITNLYLESRLGKTGDLLLLDDFIRMLPAKARELDAGCGAGIPVTQILSVYRDIEEVFTGSVRTGVIMAQNPTRRC